MAGHTPGPWKAEHTDWKGEPSEYRIYISGDHHEAWDDSDDGDEGDPDATHMVATGVCIVEGNATSREVTAANALLIRAAPTMLTELCRVEWRTWSMRASAYVCPSCDGQMKTGHTPDCTLAAAIRAATGE